MLVQVCSAGNFTWELPGWCVLYSLPCRAADHFLAKMETSLCIIFFFFLQLLKSFSVAGLLRSYRAAFKTFKTVGQIYKTTEMKNHRAEGSYTFISMLCLRSCLVVFHCLENFLPAVIPEVSPGKRKVKQGRFSFPFLSLCLLLKTDTHKPPCTFSANGRTHNTVEAGSLQLTILPSCQASVGILCYSFQQQLNSSTLALVPPDRPSSHKPKLKHQRCRLGGQHKLATEAAPSLLI